MAKSKGGAQHLSVQEAKNIQLGQLGSMFTKASEAAIKTPDGHVFIAIQILHGGVEFDASGGLIAEDPDKYFNTAQASTGGGGTGGQQVDGTPKFPAGSIIYGRWTEIDVESGSHGLIAYIGV